MCIILQAEFKPGLNYLLVIVAFSFSSFMDLFASDLKPAEHSC